MEKALQVQEVIIIFKRSNIIKFLNSIVKYIIILFQSLSCIIKKYKIYSLNLGDYGHDQLCDKETSPINKLRHINVYQRLALTD